MIQNKNVLKSYFEKGDKPTQEQYENLIDSLRHMYDEIPLADLEEEVVTKAEFDSSLENVAKTDEDNNFSTDQTFLGTVISNTGFSTGANAANNGAIRLENGDSITSRNNANSGNRTLLYLDSNNIAQYSASTDSVFGGNINIGGQVGTRPLNVFKASDGSVATFLSYTDASNFQGLYIDVSQATDTVTFNSSGTNGGGYDWQSGNVSRMTLSSGGSLNVSGVGVFGSSVTGSTFLADSANGWLVKNTSGNHGVYFDGTEITLQSYGVNSIRANGTRVDLRNTYIAGLLDVSTADNVVANFASTDAISEIRIADSSAYTRLLNVDTDFKIMPNNGNEVAVFEGDTLKTILKGDLDVASSATFEGHITANNSNITATDGTDFARLVYYGVEFQRGSNYLRPVTNGSGVLYIGGSAQDTGDWSNIKMYSDNGVQINNELIATQNWVTSQIQTTDTLQQVTDNGNQTNNNIELIGANLIVKQNSDGSGSITPQYLNFTTNGSYSLETVNKHSAGGITWDFQEPTTTAGGNIASIKSYIVDTNNIIQGSGNQETTQMEFSVWEPSTTGNYTEFIPLTLTPSSINFNSIANADEGINITTTKKVNFGQLYSNIYEDSGDILTVEGHNGTYFYSYEGATTTLHNDVRMQYGKVSINGTINNNYNLAVNGNAYFSEGLEARVTDADRDIHFKAPNGEERFKFYAGSTDNSSYLSLYQHDGTTVGASISSASTSFFTNVVEFRSDSTDGDVLLRYLLDGGRNWEWSQKNSGAATGLELRSTQHKDLYYTNADTWWKYSVDDSNIMYLNGSSKQLSVYGSFETRRNGSNGTTYEDIVIDAVTQSTITSGSGRLISFKGSADRYWGAIGGWTNTSNQEGIGLFGSNSSVLDTTPSLYLNSTLDIIEFYTTARFDDNQALELGNGSDLRIYHNGTYSYIDNTTGDFYIRNFSNDKNIRIQSDNGSGGLADYFIADGTTGEARMFYYGAEKLSTTSSGIDVTGSATADSFIKSGGASSQFLKADGSVDSNNYLTTASLANYALHNSVQSYTKQQYFKTAYVSGASDITLDLHETQVCDVELTDDRAINNPTNMRAGAFYTIAIKQDTTGSRTVSWGSSFEFGDDGIPTLSTGANKADILSFFSDGSNMLFIGIKKGYDNYNTAIPPGA